MANTSENATSIKGLFQALVPDREDVIQGIVKSVSPLTIQAVNDEKLTLTTSILIVPRHLTNYKARVDIVQGGGTVNGGTVIDGHHTHTYSGNTESDSHSHAINGSTGSGGDPSHSHTMSANTGDTSHSHGYVGTTEDQAHSHALGSLNIYGATITVYNALKVGETVHLLSFNNGKKYYILDRVV